MCTSFETFFLIKEADQALCVVGSGFLVVACWSTDILQGVIQINHGVVWVESRRIYHGLLGGEITQEVDNKREVQVSNTSIRRHDLYESSLCPPHVFKYRSVSTT